MFLLRTPTEAFAPVNGMVAPALPRARFFTATGTEAMWFICEAPAFAMHPPPLARQLPGTLVDIPEESAGSEGSESDSSWEEQPSSSSPPTPSVSSPPTPSVSPSASRAAPLTTGPFAWTVGPWTGCTSRCGAAGLQFRLVRCLSAVGVGAPNESYCNELQKPPRLQVGHWASCSTTLWWSRGHVATPWSEPVHEGPLCFFPCVASPSPSCPP